MAKYLPYGRQVIDEDDIDAVTAVMRSDWLTTGPNVEAFEQAVCHLTGARFGVAVSSGTAGLHVALMALGITVDDEVIVPPITFAATANAALYCGAKPIFADVYAESLLIDPADVERKITPKTKAIIAVDYAGQPCNWTILREIADRHNLHLVADACHALGAQYHGENVGTLADITVFSFHPVKHITTGEGGMCMTDGELLAQRMRSLRSHGIASSAHQREKSGAWFYEMTELGYNYRISDIQCALGLSQLKNLPEWLRARNELAEAYTNLLSDSMVHPLSTSKGSRHAYHLYVVTTDYRDEFFTKLRDNNIGANVHYVPVYMHPYYTQLGYNKGLCPVAEELYAKILTLPLWPGMKIEDVERVVSLLKDGII